MWCNCRARESHGLEGLGPPGWHDTASPPLTRASSLFNDQPVSHWPAIIISIISITTTYFINYSIIFFIIVSQFFSNDMLLVFLTDNQDCRPNTYCIDIISISSARPVHQYQSPYETLEGNREHLRRLQGALIRLKIGAWNNCHDFVNEINLLMSVSCRLKIPRIENLPHEEINVFLAFL